MFHLIKKLFLKFENMQKRNGWRKAGNIYFDDSLYFFPETQLYAVPTGSIKIGEFSCIRGNLEVQRDGGCIEIGERCYIGDGTRIWAAKKITIGNNVLIAHNCNIFDNDTHPIDYLERRKDAENIIWHGVREDFYTLRSSSIQIGNDVWIGANVSIMKGVIIGNRSIVGSGAVVTDSIPDDVVVVGNPAHVVKYLK